VSLDANLSMLYRSLCVLLSKLITIQTVAGFILTCIYALSATPAYAANLQRYSTINNGAITFAETAIGLNKAVSANTPGTSGAIGTLIAAGASTQNGAALPEAVGALPFAAARAVNSPGQSVGVLAVGAAATAAFVVTVNNHARATITNTATGDIDGAGAAPAQSSTVLTPIRRIAKLSISNTTGADRVVAGQTSSYAIPVANLGPSEAVGAVAVDPPATSVSGTSVRCNVASGTAACPAALTLTTFQDGVAVPTFPANSSVVFLLQCGVTATGL
jgi:hypothetical protein